MPDEPKTDFQALVKEAAETAYNPRANGRCWLLHDWSMWEAGVHAQARRCLRCGKIQSQSVGHVHKWRTDDKRALVKTETSIPHGMVHYQSCECGELRRREL